MAKNTGKRMPVKWLRDGIKSQYKKGSVCEITGSTEDLEYHHYHTMALLFDKFCKDHGIKIDSDDDVIACREDFYKEYWDEVVVDGVTLRADLHALLHSIYGVKPALSTVDKQKAWVARMKDKQKGTESHLSSRFSKFYTSDCNRFSKLLLRS